MSASAYGYPRPEDYTRHIKRRKTSFQEHALETHFAEPVEEMPVSTNMVGIEIGDTEKILEYYENALKHFQQLNCRQIAKAFIKFIEPRKQVKHPYNGGKPRAGAASGEKGDPEKTKPEWWPAGVVHKEPDHLRKEQRIRLLIHIVRKLGKFGITPEKLQEVAHDSKRQLRPTSKIDVLDEIFKVRRMEERHERGEVDANTLVYVQNRDANAKGDKDSDTISEPEQKLETEDLEEADDEFLTPPSSTEQASSSFTSSVEMTIGGHGRSMHMGGDRNQLFPLPESLSFGENPGHERSYYGTAEYPDEYSHPILKTPVTPGIVTPTEQPNAFDYLGAPFSASTTGESMVSHQRPTAMPMQQSVSQFDTWTPSYRQSMYNPMEYSSSQTIPPHVSYQIPLATTSHAAELSHTPHGLPGHPKGSSSSFRTESLSHPHMVPHHALHLSITS
ncbi:hypothetical protein BDV29DRAFT_189797 [Aspergillus leporis]|uniref:Subtelomeric hrmA-associated cluster protein AFUB-079030/YDR124W-like helical bundle domain-containing protein n=1 Tax=Aspergillus leporis TaxID=41062 RepID=A0A5N5X5F7_9EURO|nr:hypothetical protein BDV29DRAFT_189797 [Aspergillus leporis]